MSFRARAILFALTIYLATALFVLAALAASPFGHRPLRRVVLNWTRFHAWLADRWLGIGSRVEGRLPDGAYLLAIKHQAMFETLEAVRLFGEPVMVLKRELADIPLFGQVTRLYGIIAVDRAAGASALRAMVAEGRKLRAAGRRVAIFPEGTRVPAGSAPPLRPGFAGLYRALALPVVPIAMDSGEFFGPVLARRSGTVTFRIGEPIPPGLEREEIERRVHAAINLFESAAQPSP